MVLYRLLGCVAGYEILPQILTPKVISIYQEHGITIQNITTLMCIHQHKNLKLHIIHMSLCNTEREAWKNNTVRVQIFWLKCLKVLWTLNTNFNMYWTCVIIGKLNAHRIKDYVRIANVDGIWNEWNQISHYSPTPHTLHPPHLQKKESYP
jgi:hypothetical protein